MINIYSCQCKSWTGTNEITAVITASEWYREYRAKRKMSSVRDWEAEAQDEKSYE
jgi:hypothetical protein